MRPRITRSACLVLPALLAAASILPTSARAAAPARAPVPKAPEKVAVMAVHTTGVAKGVGSTLTEILTSEVASVSHLQVIGASDIQSLLGFQAQKQLLGCTDDSACLAQIGGALGVDLLVSAQVGKIGTTYVVSVKLLRIDEAKVEGRTYETVKGALDQVIGRLEAAVHTVFFQAGYLKAKAAAGPHAAPGVAAAAARPGPAGHGWHVSGWSWGLWAGGTLALAAGTYLGLRTRQAYLHAIDPGYTGGQREAQSGIQSQLLADVGFGVGAAALAAGTALLLLDHGGPAPEAPPGPTAVVVPVAGPGTLGAVATVRFR